jgi:hypothetical protein
MMVITPKHVRGVEKIDIDFILQKLCIWLVLI